MRLSTVALFVISTFTYCSSERILFLLPIASKSQKNVFVPLINALADRGHQVTVVTPFPSTKVRINVEEVTPIQEKDFLLSHLSNPFELRKSNKMSKMFMNLDKVYEACHKTFQNPDFQKVIQQEYDLVFINGFLNTCFEGVLAKIEAPHIMITTMAAPSWIAQNTGNYLPSSFVPNPFFSESDRMTFKQRLGNWLANTFIDVASRVYYRSVYESIYRQYLGDDTPGLTEIQMNRSLILMNSHFSTNYPRPNLPDNIEVGGMHCRPANPLPKDLETFVSGAEHGFIYFSLGSIVQAKNMPEEYRRIFVIVFGKLKQRVLWKWETDDMTDLPSNVKIIKWLPQQDILGHPNIKLFITHGGLLSTQETLFHGVPLLGIPMFGDQDLNMRQAEAVGFAINFEILDITEELLEEKINLLLRDASYATRAKQLSSVFRDQPETPIERAVYWSEYILRHKGAPQLRSGARDLNYFQVHSIDVIAFLLAVILTALALIKFACKKLIKCLISLLGSKKENSKALKKKIK